MSRPDHRVALITLFKEVFEGIPEGADGTWFVQGKEGIVDVLESVSFEQASRSPNPQTSTIGAHVRHLCYYLSFLNKSVRGEKSTADWAGSWAVQSFDEHAWGALKTELKKEYSDAILYFQSEPEWKDQDNLTYAFAQVCHAAYHLGAVRAMMKILIKD